MLDIHETTRYVKEHIVGAAVKLLQASGCEVDSEYAGDYVTLKVYMPPDSNDPHGDRMLKALEHARNGQTT